MRAIAFLRRNVAWMLVLVVAMAGTAYAGSKIGAKDLKSTKARMTEKVVNPGKEKIVKAHCRSGERAVGGNYSIFEVPGNEAHPIEVDVFGAGLARRNLANRKAPTKRYMVDVVNVGKGVTDNPAVVNVTVFCLRP